MWAPPWVKVIKYVDRCLIFHLINIVDFKNDINKALTMRRFILVIAVLSIIGCKEKVVEASKVFYYIDPELREYYMDFREDIESIGLEIDNDNISFSIVLGRTPFNVAGIAIGMDNKYAVNIVIDIYIWGRLSKSERKALVYHEMAHDVFGLKHNSCSLMSGGLRSMTESMRLEFLDTLTKQQNK